MLEIKNLTVKVKNDTPILTDVSLSIDEGTCIGLTGASGSGKTTLIKSIMGMNSGDLEIAQGQILLDGDNLLIHGAKERRALCGKTIGFIPQNPMTAFFPHAKMERQIIETLRMHTGLDKKQAHALAENVLRQVNLTDTKRVLSAYPGELSGGMLQRIAMALILGTKPKYVLADEPTSALDEANRDPSSLQTTSSADKRTAGIRPDTNASAPDLGYSADCICGSLFRTHHRRNTCRNNP